MKKYEFPGFLSGDATEVARRLLGCCIVRTFDDGSWATVRIVETESYDQTDAASHSYRGRTPRTDIMFGPSGYWYVYFTYGMHYCCNIVTGQDGEGSAVLIRAVEPIQGAELLEQHRGKSGIEAVNGPAKLCQALAIDKTLNGFSARKAPLELVCHEEIDNALITTTTRIGINQAKDELRRFYLTDSPYVSVRARD